MYQNSIRFTNHTSYSKWLKMPFRHTAREYFPMFFKKQTGLELTPGWKDPPLNSITRTYINKMVSIGFESHQIIGDHYMLTGISLPLLTSRRQLGGFLAVYRLRRDRETLKWVKYTHPDLVDAETPLMTISGAYHRRPNGFIVDSLSDYFKLLNWVYCQENTYAREQFKGWNKILPMIIYVDQGEDGVIEKLRAMQLCFNQLTDFSGKFVEEIKTKMNKQRNAFNINTLYYFDENPLPHCKTRLEFEDAVPILKNSFPRKTLP